MDDETKTEFSKVNTSLTDLTTLVKEDIAFNKGLDVKARLKDAEDDIEIVEKEKASWYGLYLVIGLFIAIVIATTTVAALILRVPAQ